MLRIWRNKCNNIKLVKKSTKDKVKKPRAKIKNEKQADVNNKEIIKFKKKLNA